MYIPVMDVDRSTFEASTGPKLVLKKVPITYFRPLTKTPKQSVKLYEHLLTVDHHHANVILLYLPLRCLASTK